MNRRRRNEAKPKRLALLAILGAAALAPAACAVPASEPAPAAAERLPIGGCDAAPARKLVGAPATEASGREAQRLAGAEMLRWIRPGEPVSRDYQSGRLNIETDGRNIISISCG